MKKKILLGSKYIIEINYALHEIMSRMAIAEEEIRKCIDQIEETLQKKEIGTIKKKLRNVEDRNRQYIRKKKNRFEAVRDKFPKLKERLQSERPHRWPTWEYKEKPYLDTFRGENINRKQKNN